MVDVDGQGTAKITMIRRQGPKGHGQKDMQVDVFRYSKLEEAWKSKHMQTGKAVIWYEMNSSKLATWLKDTPDPFIAYITNPLKSSMMKKFIMILLFST